MKKIIFIATILLLASACSKSQPVVPPAPDQGQATQSQNQQATSSAPETNPSATSTPAQGTPQNSPVTLNVYTNTAANYRVSYLSYFTFVSATNFKTKTINGAATSACEPYGQIPDVCFALKNQPYAGTNLTAAAVGVSILPSIKTIEECGTYSPAILKVANPAAPVEANGIVFVTAAGVDINGNNYSETHFNRAWHNSSCYQIVETVSSNTAPNSGQAINSSDIWSKLDVVRNGFSYLK